jgi:hypothetical protein
MGLLLFDLQNLKDLDGGKAMRAFRRLVEEFVADCTDRPLEDRPRKVVMELQLTPVAAEDPEFEDTLRTKGLTATFNLNAVIPDRRTRPYSLGLDPKGRPYFSSESPENFEQTTFDDLNPDTGKVDRGEVRDVKPV